MGTKVLKGKQRSKELSQRTLRRQPGGCSWARLPQSRPCSWASTPSCLPQGCGPCLLVAEVHRAPDVSLMFLSASSLLPLQSFYLSLPGSLCFLLPSGHRLPPSLCSQQWSARSARFLLVPCFPSVFVSEVTSM